MSPDDRPGARRALSAPTGAIRVGGDPAAADLLRRSFLSSREHDPRELTHGFHSYPARFHPYLVRTILSARTTPGMTICDPFCGSGTTLVEALVAGCRGVGSDLDPLAIELARVKALGPTHAHRALPDELVEHAKTITEESLARVKSRARTRTPGTQWDDPTMFAPHVFRELVGLRELLDERKTGALLRRALLLCFSSILIKVSRQLSETAAGTTERAIGKGLPTRMWQRKADELANGLRALFAVVPAGTPTPMVHKSDARRLRHLDDASIDLLITSPPYVGTFDYATHHERRVGWLELDAKSIARGEIGARRTSHETSPSEALATWQRELDETVASIARVLKTGASAFIVIGDSRVGAMAVPGDRAVRVAADAAKLTVVASAAEERDVPSNRGPRRVEEHILELQRRS